MNKTWWMVGCLALATAGISAAESEYNDIFERAPWSGSVGGGWIKYEGDQEVEDAGFAAVKGSYDFNARWTFEADLDIMPYLKNRQFEDPTRTKLTSSTWGMRLGLDTLFHLRNVKDLRWDPYLSAGVGAYVYGANMIDGQVQPMAQGGLGLFYHFDDAWALRADARWAIVSSHTEVNTILSAGVNYRFGTDMPAAIEVTGGDLDSDSDGLLDKVESEIGTDPYDPDTDQDGLMDGQEVNQFLTDPLNEDTDWDALKDGAEVLTYKTNPLDADTDDGGVADGHEVSEDNTNPLDPADDLKLFRLNIEYDYDKADIKPKYFDMLDVVVKVLQRDPQATARIEGHCDKWPKSDYNYNMRLSDRRAKGVADYIAQVGGIDRSRLTWKGFGFNNPIAPNDTPENRAKNRRTDIYIRPGGSPAASNQAVEVTPAAPVPAPAPKP